MKRRRRFLSLFLVVCLLMGLLPTTAIAAESGSRTMNYGTGGIVAGETVYYGTNSGGWTVLNADRTNTGSGGLFLLSHNVLESIAFLAYEKMHNPGDLNPTRKSDGEPANTWAGSDAQNWCTAYASTTNFTEKELAAIASVSKTDATGFISTTNIDGIMCGECSLNDEKVFLLSAEEYRDYKSVINNEQGQADWWLRSPFSNLIRMRPSS